MRPKLLKYLGLYTGILMITAVHGMGSDCGHSKNIAMVPCIADTMSYDTKVDESNINFEMKDVVKLSGSTKQNLATFCKENKISLNTMNQGKLNYSFQLKLYGGVSTIYVDVEDEVIQEIYIKPQNAKLSVWIHRFNELFGNCTEIEKVPAKEQEMKYLTWVFEQQYISIVRMNQNMYIYITHKE